MLEIEYVVVTFLLAPGRWTITIRTKLGEEFHSSVKSTFNDGPWEMYVRTYFPEGTYVKLYDWKTKSWTNGTKDTA